MPIAADPMALKTLVIGYGSPIRGDDAIGPLAAEALALAPLPAGVRPIARHILTAELVEDLRAAQQVIFLDASVEGAPGEVRVRRLTADASAVSTLAHSLEPQELLAWCQVLERHEPIAWLVSATGASFEYADCSLSPTAQGALAVMLERVHTLLETGSDPAPATPSPARSAGQPIRAQG